MSTCADHTYGPEGYVERAEWGERMVETHVQSACDDLPDALGNGHAIAPPESDQNGRSDGS